MTIRSQARPFAAGAVLSAQLILFTDAAMVVAPDVAAATVDPPAFSPKAGTYPGSQSVKISDATSGATLYYTTNGSTPTAASAKYSAAIKVSSTQTLKAIAITAGGAKSAVASATYTIETPAVAPTFLPKAGAYDAPQSVSMSDATSGATIHYTTDGTTPTAESPQYTAAVKVAKTETLKAIALATGHTDSGVTTATYSIEPRTATPVFAPRAGSYSTSQSVSITDSTAGATIYYTTNGVAPTTASSKYSGAIKVDTTEILKAIAVDSGQIKSAVASASYVVEPATATPTFLPEGGVYEAAQTVSISDATAGATIYYTTDGTGPTTSSPRYEGPIEVSATEKLNAFAVATGHTRSPTFGRTYIIATESVLHRFGAVSSDGQFPEAALVEGRDGNLYGTSTRGGTNSADPTSGYGTVFKITPDGVETVLHSFSYGDSGSTDGALPEGALVQGIDGNFYGTTAFGGKYGYGTVFKITPAGAETVLYSFTNSPPDGYAPQAGLIQGTDGNFYGTASFGGDYGGGTVFRITPAGAETVLYSFTGGAGSSGKPDGLYPVASLIEGSDHNFYGTTAYGGISSSPGPGTVFKITPSGTETMLHAFNGTPDGSTPGAALIIGQDGNLYGATEFGGTNNFGTIFKITPTGDETVLFSFEHNVDGTSHRQGPNGVLEGSDGNFYGTTAAGGEHGGGTIFKVTPAGTETLLYSFYANANDGAYPEAPLLLGSDGNFYGTTYLGGSDDKGVVFKLTNPIAPK